MIRIHGESGSGKTTALHALEAAPPEGYRAVYVPVPTLDFAGLAVWCLERLHVKPGATPVATLRAFLRETSLLLLVDDAERLPREAAAALRELEGEAAGRLALVAACAGDPRSEPALVALGPPTQELTLVPGEAGALVQRIADAIEPPGAAEALLPARGRSIAVAPPPKPAPPLHASTDPPIATRTAPQPQAPLLGVAPTQPAVVARLPAPVRAPALSPPAAELPRVASSPRAGRSVPLALAVVMAGFAFLVPVAFGAGYLIGARLQGGGATAAASLPAVSAPPTQGLPMASPLVRPVVRGPADHAPNLAQGAPAPRGPATPPEAPGPVNEATPRIARLRSPSARLPGAELESAVTAAGDGVLGPALANETNSRGAGWVDAPAPRGPARVESRDPGWGPPALISVEPADGAP